MKKRKVAKIQVWEIWIEPIQCTFSRKVRGNILSWSMALKIKRRLQKVNPKRKFMICTEFKTSKQLKAQRAFAKAIAKGQV